MDYDVLTVPCLTRPPSHSFISLHTRHHGAVSGNMYGTQPNEAFARVNRVAIYPPCSLHTIRWLMVNKCIVRFASGATV